MQNFIFISPNFPTNYWQFCRKLKNNGMNVLGIGDQPYEELKPELKESLNEYYKVGSLENYDEVYRAVAFFTFKYGRIDWLESNNEYWLERDAALRTDFHITSGFQTSDMPRIKYKSKMKEYYQKAGIATARYHLVDDLAGCKQFIAEVGYPVVVKPDNGVGASDTHKLASDADLEKFLTYKNANHPDVVYIMEEFVHAEVNSYDAIIDGSGNPIFEAGNVTPMSVMDIVNNDDNSIYYIIKDLPEDTRAAGRAAVKSFGVKSRFIHFEFFRMTEDQASMGKKGQIVALEVNMRPCGGFTPDMINFARSTNVYKIWADMIAFGGTDMPVGEHFYCAFAGRRDGKHFVYSHEQIMQKYQENMRMVDRIPDALSGAMGNQMYVANFATREGMEQFYADVLAVTDATNAAAQAELAQVLALGEPDAPAAFAAAPAATENGIFDSIIETITSSQYTYLYAALDWDEYWANEGVYAAGSTAANDQLDSHDEHDKGAFDAVSRATTNHGLHRGSFQQVATIYATDGSSYTVSHWSTDGSTFYTTDGTAYGWSKGTVTKPDGTTAKMDHYEISGTKYVPVRVANADLADFCSKYATVQNGGQLVGGYAEGKIPVYDLVADVNAKTNGLKIATKSGDGYTFSAARTGTGSGIAGEEQKTADGITVNVRSGDDVGSFGETIRVDLNGDYGELGSRMQSTEWTYYGSDSTYTNAVATYGTKFAADNWMHKSMGIQLGMTDSLRAQFPEGTDGTGYWTITIRALGYADTVIKFQITSDNIAKQELADEADRAALQAVVDQAQAKNKAQYTAASYADLQTELDESVELLAKSTLYKATALEQVTHLTEALQNLKTR